MRKFKKLSLTLALLLTAVGGAWAQTETLLTTIKATGTDSYSEETPGVVTVTHDNDHFDGDWGWLWRSQAGSITVEAKEGYTITRCVFNQPYKSPLTISSAPFKVNFIETSDPDMPEFKLYLCQGDWSLNMDGVTSIEVYGYANAPAEPPIKVTTNAAEEGATFTEASFLMPTYDVNVNYELVRDMSVKMSAEVGDGNDGYRIRIKKDGDDYVPVNDKEMLVSVSDDLDEQHPIDLTVNTDFTLVAQKKGEGDTWTDLSNDDKLSVGTFRYKVTGVGNYDGTIYSNEFVLFEGYQVVIPAGEYVTYYKDEAVRLEEKDKNDIELCTITAVEDGKAVLSDNFGAMKANKPFLLKNTTNEEKTILLIPCNEPNLAVTVAKEFKGTEGPHDFSKADMADGDYYVCNGKEFVKVRGEGKLAPNKAFLFVEGNNTPASIPFRRSIGGEGEGTTGVDNVNANLNDNEATWYDLNGRKLNGKPAQKGIYIKNGKKIVVK